MSNQVSRAFFAAALDYNFNALASLYQEGVVDDVDDSGNPPLLAVLEQVADIDLNNYTPKELAPLFERIEATVAFLLKHHASVDTKGAFDKTPVELVEENELFKKEGRSIRQLVIQAAEAPKKPDLLGEVVQRMQGIRLNNPAPVQAQSQLDQYVAFLTEIESLDKCKDLLTALSKDGKNVLHHIAEQPDFRPYKEVIRKHYNHPLFTKLLTQGTDAEQATPMHFMALHHNVDMLRWIRTSTNRQMVDFLKLCGTSTTGDTGGNVFHCLGRSCGNTKIEEAREFFTSCKANRGFSREILGDARLSLKVCEMFVELIQLYGTEEATNLGAMVDGSGCNLLTYSCFTADIAFIGKIIEFFGMTERAAAVIVSQTATTFVSPLDILAAMGRPESVVALLKFNKIAAKEAFWLGSGHFKARSSLDMCCVTRCDTQDEKLIFLQMWHLFLNHLVGEGEEFVKAVGHKSPEAQAVCRLLRSCDQSGIQFLDVDRCYMALVDSYRAESEVYPRAPQWNHTI